MRSIRLHRPSPAMVLATVALIVALGGTRLLDLSHNWRGWSVATSSSRSTRCLAIGCAITR
jgi:hypothetical protein